jgi:GDPmannose 4,6-dehydratase
MKKALVTGVTGQDGAWLAKLLLENGYEVYGGIRRTSTRNLWRLEYLGVRDRITLVPFDLLDYSNIFNTVKEVQPDELYNLAAQSFVGVSFQQPLSTISMSGMGVAYILDALKTVSPATRFYQASTSEMFGKVQAVPQDENTPFYPRSPYACAKLLAHWLTVNYRESYGMFCTSGILFNHESQLRGPEFVTRKVSMHVARYRGGCRDVLELGNVDAQRDWGFAREYVEGIHRMLQQERPDTYVLASGNTCTVRRFVEMAFEAIGIRVRWSGEGVNEVGLDSKSGKLLVRVNKEFYRPAEVDLLLGNASKAKSELGWAPRTTVAELVELMVRCDVELVH